MRKGKRGSAADADSRPAGFMLPSTGEYLQEKRRVIWEMTNTLRVILSAVLNPSHVKYITSKFILSFIHLSFLVLSTLVLDMNLFFQK